MICPRCKGAGFYQYTTHGTPHAKPCDVCCRHDQGFWLLPEGYVNQGQHCCTAGCGYTKKNDSNVAVTEKKDA